MDNSKTMRYCIDMCPPDCDDIRFSINKQEIAINVVEECQMWKQSGMVLANNLMEQYKFYQDFSFKNTDNLDDSLIERKKRICREIMTNDIALVKVRLEGNTYMKTIKSKRFTFADKLAFFGMPFFNHLLLFHYFAWSLQRIVCKLFSHLHRWNTWTLYWNEYSEYGRDCILDHKNFLCLLQRNGKTTEKWKWIIWWSWRPLLFFKNLYVIQKFNKIMFIQQSKWIQMNLSNSDQKADDFA